MKSLVKNLEREAHILKQKRFPDPVRWENTKDKKVLVAGKYADVRIMLCDLADRLENSNADVVMSVLN